MPQTSIELHWADGVYTFRLGLAQIREIQNRCGPIGEVHARLLAGRYFRTSPTGESLIVGNPAEAKYGLEDIISVIRQGLIGGERAIVDGAEIRPDAARINQLLEAYVFPAVPMRESWDLAAAIMHPAMEGYDPPGEAPPPEGAASGEAEETDPSTTAAS